MAAEIYHAALGFVLYSVSILSLSYIGAVSEYVTFQIL